jgi:peptidoglycan/xylan/chitin deacetylase (PgdA/CDA1 family)
MSDTLTKRPYTSLSLDLDNQWCYMKTNGDAGWESYPSYLDLVVPRILEQLRARDLRITFFVVGQDAALEKNRYALRQIVEAGHEVASHSFQHDPWLHLYSETELKEELARAEAALEEAVGVKPRGFRGPGFSLSPRLLSTLSRRGYDFDASVLPNTLNALARGYFFAASNLTKEEKRRRKALFGTFSDVFKPVKPFRWRLENHRDLLEIPVTTMPFFHVPVHLSYVIYLGWFSQQLAKLYFSSFLRLADWTKTRPSILLHPLDFLLPGEVPEVMFFPAMRMPSARKMAIVSWVLDTLQARYEIITMGEHARRAGQLRLRMVRA